MISTDSLRLVVFYLIIASVIFTLLAFLQIQYQYYLWEFFIDLKVAALVLLVVYLHKKGDFHISIDAFGFTQWNVKELLLWFGFPAFIYLLIAGLGMIFRMVAFTNLDNALTLVMATLFDIPAIALFSILFVLVEEMFFRTVVFNSFFGSTTKIKAIIVSAALWTFYAVPDFVTPERFAFSTILFLFLYTFLMGIFTVQLYIKYRSVLFSYVFRIGIIALTPIFLTSIVNESDPFFAAKSLIFSAEGLVFSLFILISAVLLNRTDYAVKTEEKVQNLAA